MTKSAHIEGEILDTKTRPSGIKGVFRDTPFDTLSTQARQDIKGGFHMHSIHYLQKIKKRGPFGVPYTALVLRVAHVDERHWLRLRNCRFSLNDLLIY